MIPKTISIIGGTGKMGQMFVNAFKEKGYEVIVAGRKTEITPVEAAKRGDIVIVSVPIRATEETIKLVAPHVKPSALLTDFTSVKVNPCKAMKKHSKAQVIGGHPVFGPNVPFGGQNFVLCPVRGSLYIDWYKGFLESLKMNVTLMSPDEHDKKMAVIQCLNHMSNLAFAKSLKDLDFDLKENEKFFSPAFLLKIMASGRFLAQDPELYSDIEIENPYSKQVAKAFLNAAKETTDTIKNKDKPKFEALFKESKEHFGSLEQKYLDATTKFLKSMSEEKK